MDATPILAEIDTTEYTAPFWRFESVAKDKDPAGKGYERWTDLTGGSDLNTARTDYHDCVLEGEVVAGWLGLRAGIDNAQQPKKYVWWSFGGINQFHDYNLSFGKAGDAMGTNFLRAAADMRRDKPTRGRAGISAVSPFSAGTNGRSTTRAGSGRSNGSSGRTGAPRTGP